MNNDTINDWVPETKSLLLDLQESGAVILRGDNGEEQFDYKGDLEAFIDDLIACDESHLYVSINGKERELFLVLGNEPGVIVNDYIVDPVLDAVTNAHYEKWDGKPQPLSKIVRCSKCGLVIHGYSNIGGRCRNTVACNRRLSSIMPVLKNATTAETLAVNQNTAHQGDGFKKGGVQ